MPITPTQVSFTTCSNSHIDDRLESAISLWKKNRKTLGPFPRGAFEDHAKNNWIIYLLEKNKVEGYLLYRIARNRAAIAHLCISDEVRGQGGARVLFNALRTSIDDGHCRGIEVRCRSDYEISRMWPRLGFECIRNISGRAKSGSELTIWFYQFDVHDFFYDMMPRQDDDDLTWAILDANIIFKLSNPAEIDSEEALALTSDTISPYTRYFITPELFVETERKINVEEKKSSNKFARKFEKIETKRTPFEEFRNILTPLWDNIDHDRDRSDLNHIAYTAAAGFQNFITQDEGLLKKSEIIYDACNVSVRRPVEFITELDQIENFDKYTPRSISRTKYHISCPSFDEITPIAKEFCLPSKGEKRKQLEAKIRSAVASPDKYKIILISEGNDKKVALLCFKREKDKLSIILMRHNGNVASKTVIQNFTWSEIFSKTNENITLIELVDSNSKHLNSELFQFPGFIRSEKGWLRISANIIGSIEEVKLKIDSFLNASNELSQSAKGGLKRFISNYGESASIYEEVFWPLKIRGKYVPTYLVPIKPVWALHLFDKNLAEQELWGADPAKHFNIENVYYRSPKPLNMAQGERILWYVSSSKNKRVSEIRACSRLLEVETNTAKKLFKKYKRLGIYQWENLMEITNGNPHGKVMAMRFYQTEYFKNPITLENFSEYGINGQPFGPKLVGDENFFKIYIDGMKLDGK